MKIRSEILAIISAGEFDGPRFRLPPEQLDRKVYQEVAKVFDAVGGKWSRSAKAIVFEGDAADALEPVMLTGEVTRAKQEFGQFDTPNPIALRAAKLAAIEPGMILLEPSVGLGNLAAMAEWAGAVVAAVEVDTSRLQSAQGRLLLRGGVVRGDFLAVKPVPTFHRVLMNPPFARRADIHHVNHAAGFLANAGKLVAIMSAGVAFRQDRLAIDFRRMVDDRGGTIEPLPEDSFKEAGTGVNTCLVAFGG